MSGREIRKPNDMPSSITHNGRWNPLKSLFLDHQMHIDPIRISKSITEFGSQRDKMIKWRRKYSYAIPSNDIHAKIKLFCGNKIIEMGSGTGYWAKYLSQFEIDVLAYDTIDTRSTFCDDVYYHEIVEGGPEVLDKVSKDRALFLCWPPYDDPFAYNCLKAYKGNYLIFVGEGYGGCTGDDNFFNLIEKEWDIINCSYECLNFYGISSCETIYKRKIVESGAFSEEEIY